MIEEESDDELVPADDPDGVDPADPDGDAADGEAPAIEPGAMTTDGEDVGTPVKPTPVDAGKAAGTENDGTPTAMAEPISVVGPGAGAAPAKVTDDMPNNVTAEITFLNIMIIVSCYAELRN